MTEMIFHHPSMLLLLLVVPLLVLVFRWRLRNQRRDIGRFGVGVYESEHRSMEPWRLLLLVGATVALVLALSRPAVNPHPKMIQRDGRDVVFLLDVSNSMLAEDRIPNRLESAKASIADCVHSLDDHRVGLVVFAGSSSIVCPLTLDKAFFLSSLEKAGPQSVAHGGTRIGDALIKVCDKLFSGRDRAYKDIVLLSDGGDQSDGLDKAVEQMNEKQVRLIAIGLGDPGQGSRIPVKEGASDYMLYQNREVWSRLDGAQLSGLVKATEQAAYLPVGTRRMELSRIYKRLSEEGGSQQLAEESVMAYDEIYQVFIAISLVLLLVMALTPHTRRPKVQRSRRVGGVLLWLVVLFVWGGVGNGLDAAESAHDDYLRGNAEYRKGEFEQAVKYYESAMHQPASAALIRDISYNLGNACFMSAEQAQDPYQSLGWINRSVTMFRRVLMQDSRDRDAAVNHELAKLRRHEWKQKILEEEKKRRELEAALAEVRRQLESVILAQRENLPEADEAEGQMPPAWVAREKSVADDTDAVAALLRAIDAKFFEGVPRDLTPVAACKAHVSTAFMHQLEGVRVASSSWEGALGKGRASLKSLMDALAALPRESDPSDASGEQSESGDEGEESDSSEEGDDGDGEEGENQSDGGEDGQQAPGDAAKVDLESINLPPPNNSPEDVIRMSEQMQQARQAAGAKKKGKSVEKNW